MKLHFERVKAGYYVWQAFDRYIAIYRNKNNWFVLFRNTFKEKTGTYEVDNLKKGIEFSNLYFDDFEAMLTD